MAEQPIEDLIRRARETYQRDRRFKAIADMVSHSVMADWKEPEDAARAREFAYDVALATAARLLQMIYEEDAELKALRAECERYKALALRHAQLYGGPLVIFKGDSAPPPPSRKGRS